MKACILFFFMFIYGAFLFSQGVYSKWYFGHRAALNFESNSAPPTILNNSAMYQTEGCASIADQTGNLLFYTGGDTVWNKQHSIMANGTGLYGHKSSEQSALIIKQPGSSHIYYIFTAMPNLFPQGLNYSIVDMSLAAGMGSVTTKNVQLHNNICEQLHATKHANGVDYWIMVHEYNTNNFRAYLLTSAGVNTTAVVSSVGTPFINYQSSVKFSPSGQKLAATVHHNLVELYDFNKSTGIVSNPLSLLSGNQFTMSSTDNPAQGVYGVEFSPDGTKLYCTKAYFSSSVWGNPNDYPGLIQWDISAGSNAAILSSSVSIHTASMALSALQLAPNGKIYVATGSEATASNLNGTAPAIGVINNPNASGLNCNFVYMGQPVVSTINTVHGSLGGLPNFVYEPCVSNFALSNGNVVTCYNTAAGSNTVIGTTGYPSYVWSNGSVTYTTQQVNSLSAGQWSITVTGVLGCSSQSVFTVTELPPPTFTPSIVNSSFTVCIGDSITLSASGANAYLWSNNLQTQSITVAPTQNASYYVTGIDANGCTVSSAAVTISVFPRPTLSVSASHSLALCSPQTQTLSVSGAYSYVWKWDNSSAFSTSTFLVVNPPATTHYTITGTNEYACVSSKIVTLSIGCVGIDELQNAVEQIKIYPNPANEMLNVECLMLNGKTEVEIKVIDVLGREFIRHLSFNIQHSAVLDVSELKSGIYFLQVFEKGKTLAVKKLIIE